MKRMFCDLCGKEIANDTTWAWVSVGGVNSVKDRDLHIECATKINDLIDMYCRAVQHNGVVEFRLNEEGAEDRSDLISRNSMRTAVALYMAENAYLNDTALDVLKMIDKWLLEAEAVDDVEVVRCKDCVSCKPIPNTYNSLWCDEWDNCADCDGYCHKGAKKNGK